MEAVPAPCNLCSPAAVAFSLAAAFAERAAEIVWDWGVWNSALLVWVGLIALYLSLQGSGNLGECDHALSS